MLIDELIERAFSDGYEYALEQRIFFLSPDGHAFTGEDVRKTKHRMNLEYGHLPNKTQLAYHNTATRIDQNKAWDQADQFLRRKGVEGEHLNNARQKAVNDAWERSSKEMERRLKSQRIRKAKKAISDGGFFKKLLKRIK